MAENIPTDMASELRSLMKGLRVAHEQTCAVESCGALATVKQFCRECAIKAKAVHDEDMLVELRRKREAGCDEFISEEVGRLYVDCTWDNLRVAPKTRSGIQNAISSGNSVIMSGKPGVGKTHILTCILRDRYLSGDKIAFWTCPALFDHMRRLATSDGGDLPGFINSFRKIDWLFIDDLGVGKNTEFVQEQLFRIIDWRSRDGSPVVMTSNLTMFEVAQFYDTRMASRLHGLTKRGGYGVEIKGEDGRKKGDS